MRNILKGSWTVFSRYSACLLLFFVFALTFFQYRKICTFILFLLMFLLVYLGTSSLAIFEKKPNREIKTYPLKGLLIGFLGFLPYIILTCVFLNIKFSAPFITNGYKVDLNMLKHSIQIGILCPLYIPIKLSGESTIVYIISLTIVPLISMLGYLSGYYGFDLKPLYNKFIFKKPVTPVKKGGNRNVR